MKITTSQYAHAWYAALCNVHTDQWDIISQRFLEYLHHQGHMKQLYEIAQRIAVLEYKKKGIQSVHVRSAHNLDNEILGQVLKQVLGDVHIELKHIYDPSLIGGMQIETDDHRWDISLHGELRQLKKTLM